MRPFSPKVSVSPFASKVPKISMSAFLSKVLAYVSFSIYLSSVSRISSLRQFSISCCYEYQWQE